MRNKALCKIFMFLFLALPSSSFLYAGGSPEVTKAISEGVGKLVGVGAKAASKIIEDKSPGAAKAFDTLSDIAYGTTGQNYEDHMRQHFNLQEGDPLPKHLQSYRWDEFPITFINETDYTILIKGFGISEELLPRNYSAHKHLGQIVYKERSNMPTELIIENRNPHRYAHNYELIYDKNIIEYYEEDAYWDDGREGVKQYNAKITFILKEIAEDYYEEIFFDDGSDDIVIEEQYSLNENYGMEKIYDGEYSYYNGNDELSNGRPVLAGTIPVYILGNGSLGKDRIVDYIMSKKPLLPRADVDRLVGIYISQAWQEGINHDIAIAQMCYATKYLKNRDSLITHNYMGLYVSNINSSNRYNNKYNNMAEGVKAHIQYLKSFASVELFKSWQQNNSNYGKSIIIILYDLYKHSI